MAGEEFNYRFGNKNNWRRWVWNRIVERLQVEVKDAVVIYLAGKEDYDRIIAMKHGFKHHNLIAVDRNSDVIRELKKQKVLAIGPANIWDVLFSWSHNIEIHVVLSDMCCGLRESIFHRILSCLALPTTRRAVWMINLMRGRESGEFDANLRNIWRDEISHIQRKLGYEFENFSKHRGIILWWWMMQMFFMDSGLDDITEDHRLVARSYKSISGQVFDSIVFASPSDSIRHHSKEYNEIIEKWEKIKRKGHLAGQISSVLAHRTMRQGNIGIYANGMR